MEDPDLNPEISGTDGTIGALQRWNSKVESVGEGEQQITVLTGDRIEMDLRFKRPMEGNAGAAHLFRSISPTRTEVTSVFYGESKYPMNLPAYVFGRKFVRDALMENLKNVKNNLEQK